MIKLKKLTSSPININKFISSSGYCSRRSADRLIKAGKVTVNSHLALATDKVGDDDKVIVENKEILHALVDKIYLAFNKPLGVICTTDKNSPNNIMDYIKISERVFPIGRLDVKSEGLILLTNDGELAQKILKEKIIEKEYLVNVDKTLSDDFLSKLAHGVYIDGRPTLPAKVKKINLRQFSIVIVEGRKRQIRRMCESSRYNVTKLQRTRIGGILVDNIAVGKYIALDSEKIYSLLKFD